MKIKTLNRSVTEHQFHALSQAYQYFNKTLFDGKLPECILGFSENTRYSGFMDPKQWKRKNDEGSAYSTHEIRIAPISHHRDSEEFFSTLVHEQVHLWQWEYGKFSDWGYHNRQWAFKMIEVGLMPSDTGKEGGKLTGRSMGHYVISNGKFEMACNKMPKECSLPFVFRGKPALVKNKIKYFCLSCGINVWGKSGLSLICGYCKQPFATEQ